VLDVWATCQGPYFEYINGKLYIREDFTLETFKKNYAPNPLLGVWIAIAYFLPGLFYGLIPGMTECTSFWIFTPICFILHFGYGAVWHDQVWIKQGIKMSWRVREQELSTPGADAIGCAQDDAVTV